MNRWRKTRLVAASVSVIVPIAAASAWVVRPRADVSRAPDAPSLGFKKNDADAPKGRNRQMAIGENEVRNPDDTPAVEAFLQRAYPSDDIPPDASFAAQQGWAALNAGPHSAGAWQLIGPTKATYPAVLDVFLGDGAQQVMSGRVTAMAISPRCVAGDCTLFLAAAGGGVWRTRDALAGSPRWEFVSGSFGTNAIGSLLVDPSNADIVYAATGEPNASGDSEAGVGIYKSTDRGSTWSLVPGSDMFFQRSLGRMALDGAGRLLVTVASGVRGVSSVTGGASSSGSTNHPLVPRGLYRQNGATFSQLFRTNIRGSTNVKVDPTHPNIIYVNAFSQGIWRSTDDGATFSQIFAPLNPEVTTDRSEFDVTTLSSGATRMYVGEGQGGSKGHRSNFWRSDNADTAATFTQLGGAQVENYCTGQCWYDNVVYTPKGYPSVVYLLGSFDYNTVNWSTNGRAVLLSTDGGATWSDLTQDADPHHAEFIHPDQHALVTNPDNPFQFFNGSDGGAIRSDGQFANAMAKCARVGASDVANTAYCQSLLWRVPNQLTPINEGLSTLQFQSLSASPKRPQNLLQGGTQDNGTFQFSGSSVVWYQEIYGDGGQSGFSAIDDSLRFNTFTGQASDVNFRNGDPTKWVIATGPIVASPEGAFFYPPVVGDPHPANWGTIFQGSFSVWRTQDWAGDRAYLEARCPEFTTSAADPACGDFVQIGSPSDLTAAIWGNRAGSAVSVIARSASDTGSLWAATGTGRVFFSGNADAKASSVVWTRIDDKAVGTPNRFPSTIAVDPASPAHHAWISYSGYNVNTPTTPGHVFEITWSGNAGTWTDRSYNLPDFPVTGVVYDDVTGDLYASSDFGVMRLARGATSWVPAGTGMPMVEVAGLTIVPSARLLYAATHGRGGWSMQLP